MKILIIKLSSIGDVIHTLPSLCAIRRMYSDAVIDWLVEEDAAGIIIGHNLLNDCIVVRRKKWLKKPLSNDTWRDISRVIKTLKNTNYDIVIDFQGLIKSGIWALLSKGKKRMGFRRRRELSSIFLNEALPPYNPDLHAVDRYLQLAEHIGVDVLPVEFPLSIKQDEKQKALSILKENGILEGQPFILVNPIARWETKLWGNERFASLCNLITDKFDMRVVLTGSGLIVSEIDKIIAMTNRKTINLTGKTGLKELMAVINYSKLMITVDSGPMHIAAAIGKPVIALFGPTAPWRTGPYGSGHTIIRKDLPCSPCFLRRCRDVRCMKEIKVEDVMTAVERQLNAVAGSEREITC